LEIKNKFLKSQNKRWLIVSFFISILLLLPLIFLFSNVFNIEKSEFSYLWNTLLLDYSLNTLYLVFLTGSFSLIFGIIPAWFISNYNFRLRKFFDIALYLPLAIPTYIMAFTYSDILSFTGPINLF
jgi:iron(III) transport system permease protein